MLYLEKRQQIFSDIEPLLEKKDLAVSIYIPTSKVWDENEPNKILLKNALSTVEKELKERNLITSKINKLLKPAKKLQQNEDFWRNTLEGTGIFIAENLFKTYAIPKKTDYAVQIEPFFNIKPIMNFIFESIEYYVLAISKNKIRLFKCINKSCEEVGIDIIPSNMEEALWMDDPEKQIQYHKTKPNTKTVQGAPMYHGHGAYKDVYLENLHRYLRKVDHALNKVIANKDNPLVIASIERYFSAFNDITKYPNVVHGHIEGNPDAIDKNTLVEQAWNIVKKKLEEKKGSAVENYLDKSNTSLSVFNISEIVTAAYAGKVQALLVKNMQEIYGVFDEINMKVKVIEKSPLGADLVNLSVLYTVKNGGEIYKISKDAIKEPHAVYAVLRY